MIEIVKVISVSKGSNVVDMISIIQKYLLDNNMVTEREAFEEFTNAKCNFEIHIIRKKR